MRFITLVATAFALTSAALAQGLKPAVFPPDVIYACQNMRGMTSLGIALDGVDNRSGIRYHMDTVWGDRTVGVREFAQLRIDEYADKISSSEATTLTRQIVGDSLNLWNFNVSRREYSASQYGVESGKQPNDYRDTLLISAGSVAQGQTVNILRALREIYGGTDVNMHFWLPLNDKLQVTELTDPTKSTNDAVVPGRTYTPTDNRHYYLFDYSSGYQRSMAIELSKVTVLDKDMWIVSAIFNADNTGRGLQDWVMTFTAEPGAAASTFTFTPPVDARGIARSGG